MTLYVKPEAGIPLPEQSQSEGFVPMLSAAAGTARLLQELGLETDTSIEDLNRAEDVAKLVAADPGKVRMSMITGQTPAAVLLTKQILDSYGHKIVEDAERVRHLVVNKLVQETENKDPKIRIRALELLGKMGDVGLFTERKEVTITHQSSDDVKDRLRARLARLLPQGTERVEDAEIVEATAVPEAPDEPCYELSLEAKPASASLFEES